VSPPEERVWGAAYYIPPEHAEDVRSYLDIREVNGYSLHSTPFFPASSSKGILEGHASSSTVINCLVYIGLPTNPQFAGPQDPEALAKHILRGTGPSGPNIEYLYMLEESLANLSPESEDLHVKDLASRCRRLEAMGTVDLKDLEHVEPSHLHKVGSTEEQEEIEK
jgi:cation transport regulator ChaC